MQEKIQNELIKIRTELGELQSRLSSVITAMENEEIEPEFICKYCEVNKNGSTCPDKLCNSCAEDFGHSLFSEL